jgi:PhnB protein
MAKKIAKKAAKKVAKKTAKKAVKKTAKKASAKKAAAKKPVKKARPAAKKAAKKAPVKAEPKSTMINPYLTFNGNCEEAFHFYRSVFGGNFSYLGRFKEFPGQDGTPVSGPEGEKIMHVSLPISRETILMGSDTSEGHGPPHVAGNNFSISVSTFSQSEADKLYHGLSHGGKEIMPMSKTFWGSYFGMLTDKFDIQWMVSFDEPKK